MSNRECCVIIPVYRELPTENEQFAIRNCVGRLGDEFDIVVIAPADTNIDFYRSHYKTTNCVNMKDSLWKSVDRNIFPNYNRMMQSVKFYKMFLDYSYILICQPDALILQGKRELKRFIKMGYDYIGGRFHKDYPVIAAPKM